MAAGQQVAFKPTLALGLAKYFHHPAIGADVIVAWNDFRRGASVRHLEHGVPSVRGGFVRAEDTEIACVGVAPKHIAYELALDARDFGCHDAMLRDLDCVVAEVRHFQIFKQKAAIGIGVRSHAPLAFGRQLSQFRNEPAVLVE